MLIFLLVHSVSAAALVHRYPFDTNANDVIGSSDGTLRGNAFVADGAVHLDGTNSYVDLPADLITNFDSFTVEMWLVDEGADPDACLFFFGKTTWPNSIVHATFGSLWAGNIFPAGGGTLPRAGRSHHLVRTFEKTPGSDYSEACFFIDGVLALRDPSFQILLPVQESPSVNRLGAAVGEFYQRVLMEFRGRIQEFRVYVGALSSLEVAWSNGAGPDQPGIEPGQLRRVRLQVPTHSGPGAILSPVVLADFDHLINVNLSGQPELAVTSDATNVVEITTKGKLRTRALGIAQITAAYRGCSDIATVAIVVPQGVTLANRYRFEESFGERIVHDSVGDAHGRLMGDAAFFTTDDPAKSRPPGQLALNLKGGTSYVDLPDGIISSHSEVSLEAWVLTRSSAAWQRVFDFGENPNNYFFLTPNSGLAHHSAKPVLRATITTNTLFAETPRLDGTRPLMPGAMNHLAVTYSPYRGIARLYLNGKLVDSDTATIPLSGINDVNNWLGRSQFDVDPYLEGRYDEFRIYDGLLTDADVAASCAVGPDVVGLDLHLQIAASGSNVVISWGASAADWVIQSRGPGTNWRRVPVAPALLDGKPTVTVPMSERTHYFRLRKPEL